MSFVASSNDLPVSLAFLIIGRATIIETTVETAKAIIVGKYDPLGVSNIQDISDPGDGDATSPPLSNSNRNVELIPPKIVAIKSFGFISIYGKYISWIPPNTWIIEAPNADAFSFFLPAII